MSKLTLINKEEQELLKKGICPNCKQKKIEPLNNTLGDKSSLICLNVPDCGMKYIHKSDSENMYKYQWSKVTQFQNPLSNPTKSVLPDRTSEREDMLEGSTYKMKTGCGNLFVTVNRTVNGKICEVFQNMNPLGGCGQVQVGGMGVMISVYLQLGGQIDKLFKLLGGTTCPKQMKFGGSLSCIDATLNAVKRELNRLSGNKTDKKPVRVQLIPDERCPECQSPITYESGCKVCKSCGWTSCE